MKSFAKLSAVLAAIICMAFQVSAVEISSVDLGSLSPDVTYSFPGYSEVIADYTPSVSGPVKFLWSGSPLTLYSSPDHSEEDIVGGSHSYTQNGQLISYPYLEAGHTYYIYSVMTLMATDLVIHEGETVIELVGVTPSADPDSPGYDGRFSASRDYRIDLYFNFPVTVGNCLLMAGDERIRITPMVNNATVSFDVNEAVMSLYNGGFLKEGDIMTLRLLQVKDAMDPEIKYGETGRLEIDFEVDGKPAELVDTKGYDPKQTDNPFLSYYLPGDPEALMQMVFDRDIDPGCTPLAQITYGNPDNLDLGIYSESIPGLVEGNMVTFDFSGKLRRRADMLPGADVSELPTSLYVAYTGILTPDGQRAYTGMISNPTGFSTSYTVRDLQFTIAADFSPARGTALRPGSDMEIWVMNGDKIQFSDICIDFMQDGKPGSIAVGKENVAVSADPYSAAGTDMLFNFVVPEFQADADSDVSVYMSGLICADGLDHSADIRASFLSATSGVDAMASDVSADVLDISGRVVRRQASRSDLRSLPAGIYLFNGQKLIIHK